MPDMNIRYKFNNFRKNIKDRECNPWIRDTTNQKTNEWAAHGAGPLAVGTTGFFLSQGDPFCLFVGSSIFLTSVSLGLAVGMIEGTCKLVNRQIRSRQDIEAAVNSLNEMSPGDLSILIKHIKRSLPTKDIKSHNSRQLIDLLQRNNILAKELLIGYMIERQHGNPRCYYNNGKKTFNVIVDFLLKNRKHLKNRPKINLGPNQVLGGFLSNLELYALHTTSKSATLPPSDREQKPLLCPFFAVSKKPINTDDSQQSTHDQQQGIRRLC